MEGHVYLIALIVAGIIVMYVVASMMPNGYSFGTTTSTSTTSTTTTAPTTTSTTTPQATSTTTTISYLEILPAASTAGTQCPPQSGTFTIPLFSTSPGFMLYNVSGMPDYVIPPGSGGSINYSVALAAPPAGSGPASQGPSQVRGGLLLSHTSRASVAQNISTVTWATITKFQNGTAAYVNYSLSGSASSPQARIVVPANYSFTARNGSTIVFPGGSSTYINTTTVIRVSDLPQGTTSVEYYTTCYTRPDGVTVCTSNPAPSAQGSINVSYTNYTHIGINYTFAPPTVQVPPNASVSMSANFIVAQSAPSGTYLLQTNMSGERCGYGPFAYLTVGTQPYSGA